jgi:type I restriction enzyme S subunit
MSIWKTYKLGEIATRIGDGLHGTPKYDENGEYYFINGSNLINGKIVINSNTRKVDEIEYLKHKKELSDNTILVGINGTIGNIALYQHEKCILGKSAAYINVNDSFDKLFIRYVLANEHFQRFIKTNASGTTIKNVGLGLLREYEFQAPKDKSEQIEIAQILSSLDNKIEQLQQMNQTLENIAQAIFKEWCCVEEDIIPEGWSWKKLIDIADVSSSKRIFREEYKIGGIPFYRGKEVTQLSNGEAISTELFISEERYNQIKEKFGVPQIGDILITSVGTIGSVWLVDNDSPFYFKDGNVTWVKDYKTVVNGEFIYEWLQTKETREQIKSVTIGSTQQALTISALRELRILIPDTETVSKVCNELEKLNAKRINNLNQIQTLTQTRDTLLPKLMSGSLEIN